MTEKSRVEALSRPIDGNIIHAILLVSQYESILHRHAAEELQVTFVNHARMDGAMRTTTSSA